MPSKWIYRVVCEAGAKLNAGGGELLHGWFFSALKAMSPKLADELHSGMDRPFSISPLWLPNHHPEVPQKYEIDKEYVFVVGALSEQINEAAEVLAEAYLNNGRLPIVLGSGRFRMTGYQTSGWQDYNSLLDGGVLERLNFEFLSPTSFRQKGEQMIFPVPDNVFGSLLRKWNAHSQIQYPDGVLAECVNLLVSRYNLATEVWQFDRYKVIGFVGRVSYRPNSRISSWTMKTISALARFAEFSAVGYKTTMGLGQTRLA